MRHPIATIVPTLLFLACGGGQKVASPGVGAAPPTETTPAETTAAPPSPAEPEPTAAASGDSKEFVLKSSPKSPNEDPSSKVKPTATEAAMKFTVVDKEKGPIPGIVVSLTGADGKKYYTEETDAQGYAEALVPVGQKYDLVFLSLGRREIAASVNVTNEPNQNVRLTLRYKRENPPKPADPTPAPRFVLTGVTFDTGKATIKPESFPRLDAVVEYMTHKKSARIEISGHTDNVGDPKANKTLSQKRAQACRTYLMSKGIDGGRIEAIGYGDERPISANTTDEGRQRNRRIEAMEL